MPTIAATRAYTRSLVLLATLVVAAAAAGPAAATGGKGHPAPETARVDRFAPAAQDATPNADLEANKALAQRFHDDLFNEGNLAAADEILTDDFVWYSPPQTVFLVGPEAIKQQAAGLRVDWPDVVITTDDVIAEGDRVVNRWTLRATASTEDGQAFSIVYTGIDIFRIENGRLAELWQNTDDLGLDQQFAAAAAQGTPTAGTPTS